MRPRWPQALADKGSRSEYVDHSTISQSSVKPRRAKARDVLDHKESRPNAGRRATFEVAGWKERLREWCEFTEHSMLLDNRGLRILCFENPSMLILPRPFTYCP